MKSSKHKPLTSNHQPTSYQHQYHSQKHVTKKASINPPNHLPLSSHSSFAKNPSESVIYESWSQSTGNKIKFSPYIQLPSVMKDENNQNLNSSNMSDAYGYYSQKPCNQSSSAVSIYEKLRLDSCRKKGFETEESQETNYFIESTNKKRSSQSNIYSQKPKHQSSSRSKCLHKSPNFTKKTYQNPPQQYFSINQNYHHNDNQNRYTFSALNKSQQLIKRNINDKLDRVCEKIENLSREKDRSENKKNHHHYHSVNGPNVKWVQQNSIHKQQSYNDNIIQHRILSPPKPTHQEFLESRIIQMDKKIIFTNTKILKLEEELLQQKEKLIRKEKQWLLRENQLLSWIEENQVEGEFVDESPTRNSKSSSKKSRVIAESNVIVDQSKQNLLREQIQKYKDACHGLWELINKILTIFKLNQNWLSLMNRTLSHELPGTAFRVKQEMNLNSNFFKEIEKLCYQKITKLSTIQSNIASNSLDCLNSNNFSPLANQIQSPPINSSNNSSEVYLLESYCPPVSQHYEIHPTKRATSNIKPLQNQRKSFSCLSESKSISTTNMKNNISTHKKSTKKENKPIQVAKIPEKINRSLYESRKSQYYCDEVFYSRAREGLQILQGQDLFRNSPFQNSSENELYYLLSLQALTIQTLIPHHPTANTTIDHQQEENLLSGMDA